MKSTTTAKFIVREKFPLYGIILFIQSTYRKKLKINRHHMLAQRLMDQDFTAAQVLS